MSARSPGRLDRAARRRLERGLEKLLEKDGDHCTLCRRAFAHGDTTFGGGAADGRAVITGECCAAQLTHRQEHQLVPPSASSDAGHSGRRDGKSRDTPSGRAITQC